jgi:hypothetical protein
MNSDTKQQQQQQQQGEGNIQIKTTNKQQEPPFIIQIQ